MTTETVQPTDAATNEVVAPQNADDKPVVENKGAEEPKPAEEKVDDKPAETEAELTFEVPEGVELDEASLTQFKDVLKDKTLTEQQRAQKVLDIAVAREQARTEAFAKQVSAWADEVKADPVLGTPENLAVAKSVVDTFGDDDLRSLLNSTGMGNHPTVVRLFHKIGKAISEDTFVAGKPKPESAGQDAATKLYGSN